MSQKKCLICGGTKFDVIERYVKPVGELRQCKSCDHIYLAKNQHSQQQALTPED